MRLIASVSLLWFRLMMSPKVIARHDGDMHEANVKPSIPGRVMAKYSVQTA